MSSRKSFPSRISFRLVSGRSKFCWLWSKVLGRKETWNFKKIISTYHHNQFSHFRTNCFRLLLLLVLIERKSAFVLMCCVLNRIICLGRITLLKIILSSVHVINGWTCDLIDTNILRFKCTTYAYSYLSCFEA